jgi:hypothetical protein
MRDMGRHKYEMEGEMYVSCRVNMGPNLAPKERKAREMKKKRRKYKSDDCIIFLNVRKLISSNSKFLYLYNNL